MIEQRFGPRKYRDTRRPRADQCPDVVFYRCRSCDSLFPATEGQTLLEKRTLCCNEEVEHLAPTDARGIKGFLELNYQATGSYNDGAVEVSWETRRRECTPQWIYLKTFTGGCLRYVMKGKCSSMIFALADAGAFYYYDEDPCLECVLHRERGFAAYTYSEGTGPLEVLSDQMTAHW